MTVLRMTDLDLAGKRVLIRQDLNVPILDGKITSDARLRASLPTLKLALEKGASVLVISHLGRPKAGKLDPEASLTLVAAWLSNALGRTVQLRSEEHTSELQSLMRISYAVFCLKKKNTIKDMIETARTNTTHTRSMHT